MKKSDIYQNQSQELLRLFEEAGDSAKVMCVPIDYAKSDHTVMFCSGNGDIMRKPFSVKNNPAGVEYLSDQVRRSGHHRGIKTSHIFFGGEDVGSYADNFISALRSDGWLVAGVNAHDAKKLRENMQASTDRIDLMGIAKMLLNKRANCSPAQSGIYRELRNIVRHRASLVVMSTSVTNQIHTIADRLFPGFLNDKKSGISPFSKSSLYLMENRFSAPQIRRRQRNALIKVLSRCGVQKPENVADKLKHYATQVLTTPDEYVNTLQISLTHHVRHYRCQRETIDQLEKETAVILCRTQGAFLTGIRGIGIVLAAGVTSEIGDPSKKKPLNCLTSYSGIIPRVKQTGGRKGDTYTGKVSKRCNRILKNYVVQSASHMGLHGPDDLMADHKRRDASGQHADFGIGRRFLRTAMCLMKSSMIYLPAQLRKADTAMDERAGYYLMIRPHLRDKWKNLNALEAAFADDRPLGQWRNIIQGLYDIKLKL